MFCRPNVRQTTATYMKADGNDVSKGFNRFKRINGDFCDLKNLRDFKDFNDLKDLTDIRELKETNWAG